MTHLSDAFQLFSFSAFSRLASERLADGHERSPLWETPDLSFDLPAARRVHGGAGVLSEDARRGLFSMRSTEWRRTGGSFWRRC
jgi:hypothetical protein